MKIQWANVCLILCLVLPEVSGHGRLIEPPARGSMWRFGFNTPANYDDNGLNCGGMFHQWQEMNGLCGICGDPWDQSPRLHEGLYATGTIARTYAVGQAIDVTVDITAHHKGWFEFRLCPHDDVTSPVNQTCLNNYLLDLIDGTSRYMLPDTGAVKYTVQVQLPTGLTCNQCVLQWKYNAGNSYGCNGTTCCTGCGQQEQFYGCADISITNTPITTPSVSTTIKPAATGGCRAVPPYDTTDGMDEWCVTQCAAGNCPSTHCTCT